MRRYALPMGKRNYKMNKFRVWFGLEGSVYAGEDPACPSYWKGSGCYDVFENKTILVVADIWCKEENIEDLVLELCKKEFDMDIDAMQIVKHAWVDKEDDDDPDEYIDDWHVIKEKEGSMKGNLRMSDFDSDVTGVQRYLNENKGQIEFTKV